MRQTKAGHPKWSSFQSAFESAIAGDPDMAKPLLDMPAVAGSLNHSNSKCGMRSTCGWQEWVLVPQCGKCKSSFCVMCDGHGMFDVALVNGDGR